MNLKDLAHEAVACAIADGRLSRPTRCAACLKFGDETTLVHHHPSYRPDHFLTVVELCRSCHGLVHQRRIVDPGAILIGSARSAVMSTPQPRKGRAPSPDPATVTGPDLPEPVLDQLQKLRSRRGWT